MDAGRGGGDVQEGGQDVKNFGKPAFVCLELELELDPHSRTLIDFNRESLTYWIRSLAGTGS